MFIKEKIKSVVVDEFDRDGEHYYVVASAYKAADSSISADYKTIASIDCVRDEQRIPLGEEVAFDEDEEDIKRLPIKFGEGKRIGNIVGMFKLLASMPKERIEKANRTYFLTRDGKIPAGKDVLDPKLTNHRFGRMLDVIEDIANEQGTVRLDREAFLKKQPLINELKDQKYEIEDILQKPIDNWGDDLNHALDVYSVRCSYVLSYTAKIKKRQQKENMEEEQSLGL